MAISSITKVIPTAPPAPSRSDPATFPALADTFVEYIEVMDGHYNTLKDQYNTYATQANDVATDVNTNATTATTQAGIATTKASEAAASAASVNAANIIHTTGSGLDNEFGSLLVNTLTSTDATKALTAAQGKVLQGELDGLQDALDGKAPLASPTLTGTPTAPTPATADNSTNVATTAFVSNKFNLTGTAPAYACRAWVNFNGMGTVAIRASGNVSSITDNGTGDYTVNFTTAMVDVNYSMFAQSGTGNGRWMSEYDGIYNTADSSTFKTASSCRVAFIEEAGILSDNAAIYMTIFR